MTLDEILLGRHRSDAIGRTSWYEKANQHQPKVFYRSTGWLKRNRNAQTGEITMDPYPLTDEDRLADDWVIVQSDEDPNP